MAKAREESTKERNIEPEVEMPISTSLSTLHEAKEEKCKNFQKVEPEVDIPTSTSVHFSAQSMTRRRLGLFRVICGISLIFPYPYKYPLMFIISKCPEI
jgi:hypothetical protein